MKYTLSIIIIILSIAQSIAQMPSPPNNLTSMRADGYRLKWLVADSGLIVYAPSWVTHPTGDDSSNRIATTGWVKRLNLSGGVTESDPLSFHISDTAAKTWDWGKITGKPSISGAFIPLSGTVSGSPVTGDILFSGERFLYSDGDTCTASLVFNDNNTGFGSSGPAMLMMQYDANSGISHRIGVVPQGIWGRAKDHELLFDDSGFGLNFQGHHVRGLYADGYYGAYYDSNSYVQKKYVDSIAGSGGSSLLYKSGFGIEIKSDTIGLAMDTIYIVAGGQSNMEGGAADGATADTTGDDRLLGWHAGLAAPVRLSVGRYPMNPANLSPSIAFYLGRKIIRAHKNKVVVIISVSESGQPIQLWHDGTTRGRMIDTFNLKINQIKNYSTTFKNPNAILWAHGETIAPWPDGIPSLTLAHYVQSRDSVKAIFRLGNTDVPFVVISVPDIAKDTLTQGIGYAAQLRALNSVDRYEDFVSTDGVPTNPGNPIHYNSAGLKQIGEDGVLASINGLPKPAGRLYDNNYYYAHKGGDYGGGAPIIYGSRDSSDILFNYSGLQIARLSPTFTAIGRNSYTAAASAYVHLGLEAGGRNGSVSVGNQTQSYNAGTSTVAIGTFNLQSATNVNTSTIIGSSAANSLQYGENNISIGAFAGSGMQSGDANVIIGGYGFPSGTVTSRKVIFADGYGQVRFFSDTENAGVFTTNPSAKLHVAGDFKTDAPSASGAGNWKFGKVITGATVTLTTNKFVEVMIDGVVVKLAVVE